MMHKKILCHEMALHDMFLQRFQISPAVLIAMLKNRASFLYFGLVCLLMFTVDPHHFREVMRPWQALMMWPIAVIVYLSVITLLIFLLASVQQYAGRFFVYEPLIGMLAFLVAFFQTEALAEWFSSGTFEQIQVSHLPFLTISVMSLQLIYIRFVMPQAISEGHPPRNPEDVSPQDPPAMTTLAPIPLLTIGDRKLRIASLLYMVSEEHYVRITTIHETIVQRARLRDLVAQLDFADGFQPHRSWWIGAPARPRLERVGTKPQVILLDGTSVPVAKARLDDVQNWLDFHADWSSNDAKAAE